MWQSLYISNCCFIASIHIHYSNVYIYYNTIKGFFVVILIINIE